MAEYQYRYRPEAPFASDGQPLYFVRVYQPNGADPLWIYGYSFRLTGEDWSTARDVWARRRAFYAWCMSIKEPEGEPGFVAVDDVQEITREEFEQAAAEGWPLGLPKAWPQYDSDWPLDEVGMGMLRVIAERPRRLTEVFDALGLTGEVRDQATMQAGILGARDYLRRSAIAADAKGDPFNALAITAKGREALDPTTWDFTDAEHGVIIDSLRVTRDRLREQGIDTPNVEAALRKANAMATAIQARSLDGGFQAVISKPEAQDLIQRFPARSKWGGLDNQEIVAVALALDSDWDRYTGAEDKARVAALAADADAEVTRRGLQPPEDA